MYKVSRIYLLALIGSLVSWGVSAQSNVHRKEALFPNEWVERLSYSNGYTMLSGYFDEIGPYTGGGVLVDATTGQRDTSLPKVNGYVQSVQPDGVGGWYIGGNFNSIGDIVIQNLAHIKADKTVDTDWMPNPSASVYTLVKDGTTLYVGGYFSVIGGQTRNYAAAFDLATGNLTAWSPNPNNLVLSIVPAGSTVYLGGYFTTIGGQSRNYLAAVNSASGNTLAWAPTVNSYVYSLAATGNTVFVGGSYTSAGGQARSGIAAFNGTTGALLPWSADLSASGYAFRLVPSVDGSVLYVGGNFSSIGGETRINIAAVTTETGIVTAWNPIIDGNISDIAISGNTMYVAGSFYEVNSTERRGFAALSLTDASLQSWQVSPNESGETLAVGNGQVFVGGYFEGLNWQRRNGFALIDEATGQLWPHELDINGTPYTIAVRNNILYIGGQFTAINRSARKNLAAVDLTTGQLLPDWDPVVTGTTATLDNTVVHSMEISGNTLYIGGRFLTVDGLSRPNLAAIDVTTGSPLAWNPTAGDGKTTNQFVYSIDVSGNTVYVAGDFTLLGSQARTYIGAVDATTGTLSNWNPVAVSPVFKVAVTANTAYVLGNFSDGIAGAIRNGRIAGISLTTATATDWNPDFGGAEVSDFALTPTDIYLCGWFYQVNEEFRRGMASFSLETGALSDWNPDMGDNGEGGYNADHVVASSSRLFVSGGFSDLGNEYRQYYAEYDLCAPATLSVSGSTLTASAGDSYQWFVNGEAVEGATSQTFESSLIENGVYAVEVTVGGCTQRSADHVYLITDNDGERPSLARIYPNPVKEELFIEVPSSAELTVFDLMGRPVKTAKLSFAGPNRLETHELKNGPYVLMIRTGNTTTTYKILKTY